MNFKHTKASFPILGGEYVCIDSVDCWLWVQSLHEKASWTSFTFRYMLITTSCFLEIYYSCETCKENIKTSILILHAYWKSTLSRNTLKFDTTNLLKDKKAFFMLKAIMLNKYLMKMKWWRVVNLWYCCCFTFYN